MSLVFVNRPLVVQCPLHVYSTPWINAQNRHYQYRIYKELNPTLSQCPYLESVHPICNEIMKIRLGSHILPIETGRWNRTVREIHLLQHSWWWKACFIPLQFKWTKWSRNISKYDEIWSAGRFRTISSHNR